MENYQIVGKGKWIKYNDITFDGIIFDVDSRLNLYNNKYLNWGLRVKPNEKINQAGKDSKKLIYIDSNRFNVKNPNPNCPFPKELEFDWFCKKLGKNVQISGYFMSLVEKPKISYFFLESIKIL